MKLGVLALSIATMMAGCSKKEDKASQPDPSIEQNSGEETGDGSFATELTEVHTGFDGSAAYSIFLPGRTEFTIKDPTIASLEGISVTLSANTIWELIQARKAKDPNFDEAAFRKSFPAAQKAYRLIPLKAGKTVLTSTKDGKSTEVALTVTQYPADATQVGEARYTNTSGSGKKRACLSCHGGDGAPSHAMGRVMQISDAEALQWITTGKVRDRIARVTHTWEFESDAEATGVIAYLRTLQTDDLEVLTKMMFESEYEDFQNKAK